MIVLYISNVSQTITGRISFCGQICQIAFAICIPSSTLSTYGRSSDLQDSPVIQELPRSMRALSNGKSERYLLLFYSNSKAGEINGESKDVKCNVNSQIHIMLFPYLASLLHMHHVTLIAKTTPLLQTQQHNEFRTSA